MITVSCRYMLLAILTMSLSACSLLGSYFRSDYSVYKNYVSDQVVEARLFVDGEQRLAVKAIAATAELKEEQEKVSPGFSFEYKADRNQVIAAINAQNRIPLIADDLKFLLGGTAPISVKEYTGNFLVETLYPYAYPYYRVFLVEFPKTEAQGATFQVLSSRGRIVLSLKYPKPLVEDARL